MDANEYAAKRRMVAEAMGWRNIVSLDNDLCGYEPGYEGAIDAEATDGAWVPDFLADPAAAWELLQWMRGEGLRVAFMEDYGRKHVHIPGPATDGFGATDEAALFAAAVAWVEARRKDAGNG